MKTKEQKNQIILLGQDEWIGVLIEQFLADKRSQNLAKTSLKFYQFQLGKWNEWCDAQSVKTIEQLTPQLLREYLLYLAEKNHNVGGVNTIWRAIRAFMNWAWDYLDAETKNPVDKVKPPKNHLQPLEAVTEEQFDMLVSLCKRDNFIGERDRSILMLLLDTGLRAQECCDIRIEDIDVLKSSIFIPKGKGNKARTVFFGRETRKQLRRYIKHSRNEEYLFSSQTGEKMSYSTLRQLVRRMCDEAGIEEVSLHSFRRAFALNSLRNGLDLLTISRLMGHADLSLLKRYINQNTKDLEEKFRSAVDNFKL